MIWHGSGFYQNRPKWGAPNSSSPTWPDMPKPDTLLSPGRRRLRRPDRCEPHVLLGRVRRLRIEHDAQRLAPVPDQPRAARRFLADASTPRAQLVVIYDPLTGDATATAAAVRRQRHSAEPSQSVAAAITGYLPAPDTRRQRRQQQLHPDRRDSTIARYMYTGKVDHRFTNAISLTGSISTTRPTSLARTTGSLV